MPGLMLKNRIAKGAVNTISIWTAGRWMIPRMTLRTETSAPSQMEGSIIVYTSAISMVKNRSIIIMPDFQYFFAFL